MKAQPAMEHVSEILIVEDAEKFAGALRDGLETAGYKAQTASTGEEGFFLASQRRFDLITLDLMLPRCSGFDLLGMLRSHAIMTPVLALTAKETVEDRVQALDQGADDYLIKPCTFAELLARIRALLRRGQEIRPGKLRFEDLELDASTRQVSRGMIPIELTAREFEVIEYLLRFSGKVISRETLAREIWRARERETPIDNVIDVTMARLRRKLDEPFDHKLLRTVRGLGYVIG